MGSFQMMNSITGLSALPAKLSSPTGVFLKNEGVFLCYFNFAACKLAPVLAYTPTNGTKTHAQAFQLKATTLNHRKQYRRELSTNPLHLAVTFQIVPTFLENATFKDEWH